MIRLRKPKQWAVLAELARQLKGLYRTQAVKLPYLVDLVSVGVFGHPITDAKYEAWEQGVVAPEIWKTLKHNDGGLLFEPSDEADPHPLYRLQTDKAEKLGVGLTEEEREIVAYVAEEFGSMPQAELGQLTKHLNPDISDWGGSWSSSPSVEPDEDSYARLSQARRDFLKRLPTMDLDDQSKWEGPVEGDPEEYIRQRLFGHA
jgi:uncharacterized phage-associated protein